MSYDSLMTQTCYMGSATTSTNEFGETRPESWTYSTTGTDCRFMPITLEERVRVGGEYQNINYKVFFKSGAGVTLGGRIRWKGNNYLVRQRYYDSSFHHITCLVEEL